MPATKMTSPALCILVLKVKYITFAVNFYLGLSLNIISNIVVCYSLYEFFFLILQKSPFRKTDFVR